MRAIGIKNILNEVRMSVASTHSRKSTHHSYKSTKLNTIQRATPSRPPDPRSHLRTITAHPHSHPNTSLSNPVRASAITKTYANTPHPLPTGTQTSQTVMGRGMNDNFLFLRK